MTLKQQMDSLFELYGSRNAMYMQGDQRLFFLLNAVRALGKLIRKRVTDKNLLSSALASVFSRTCCYADAFVHLDIIGALEAKYPCGHCAYCGHLPCSCAANRQTEIVCATTTGIQQTWSIRDWCTHIDYIYGATNRERGIDFALGRLYEEICEASDTKFLDTHDHSLDLCEVRRRMAHEFADIFAWICSLAILLEIDIEPVLKQRYHGVCRRCQKRPCDCGHFSIDYQLESGARAESTLVD